MLSPSSLRPPGRGKSNFSRGRGGRASTSGVRRSSANGARPLLIDPPFMMREARGWLIPSASERFFSEDGSCPSAFFAVEEGVLDVIGFVDDEVDRVLRELSISRGDTD